jgi:hypothetical protein
MPLIQPDPGLRQRLLSPARRATSSTGGESLEREFSDGDINQASSSRIPAIVDRRY